MIEFLHKYKFPNERIISNIKLKLSIKLKVRKHYLKILYGK